MQIARWCLLLVGCGRAGFDSVGTRDALGVDVPSDQTGSSIDALTCFGAGTYAVCLPSAPVGPLNVGAMLDTVADPACLSTQPSTWASNGQPDACFVVGTTVSISDVAVRGARPLVIVASDKITVTGTLDAAAHVQSQTVGPGAPSASCAVGTLPQTSTNGGGGGAGATFMARGGNGGSGDAGATNGGISANALSMPPTTLRAGCNAQSGGTGGVGGSRGRGGGAIYLVAGNTIELTGSAILNVSGAGGGWGGARGAGAGGGSGGMIVLYASTISIFNGARVVANGGGGGGGSSGPLQGNSGEDPDPTQPLTGALGGSGGCTGTGGGRGYPSTTNGGNAPTACGGGGGGGGAGYIQANAALTNATVSPQPTIIP